MQPVLSEAAAEEQKQVRRVQQGDREAFAPLIERHQPRVRSLVYHLVRRRDEIDDITQEVFLKAFRAIRSYNFDSTFGTWLGRIAVNHCYDYLRREQKARVSYHWQMPEDVGRAIEENVPGAELRLDQQTALRDLVEKLLDRAPPDDRIVLTLKEIEGRSVEEIAALLGLRVSTVKVRLHRARKRMLADLERLQQGR
jgi:RNA polymerase sigma-70 factor (ECF subfamily)